MQKFSLLLNTILSFLFIGLVTYGLIQKSTADASTIFAICYIVIINTSFLWFNYIYFKTRDQNDSMQILPYDKTGKVLSVIVIILGTINIVFALLATVPFISGETQATKRQLIGLSIFIFLSLVAGVTAIYNAWGYRKLLKQHKTIVNSVINTIGSNSSV